MLFLGLSRMPKLLLSMSRHVGIWVGWQIIKWQSEEEGNQKERVIWEWLFKGHA